MVTAAPPTEPIASPPPLAAGAVVPHRHEGATRKNLRPWIFPGVLALLVGLFANLTPFMYLSGAPLGLWGDDLATVTLIRPVMELASLSATIGVLFSRRSRVLACVLAAWPFLLTPLVATFVWAWWLALLAIAVVCAYDGWRRAALPFVLAMGVAAGYCVTGIYAMLPVGPVTPGSGDTWITFVLYVVCSVAALAVSTAVGANRRARARTVAADRASEQALAVETVAVERARIAHDLHDVVAHHVSLVAVRAESAPYVHPSMDADAKAVLADIADDARHALGELRQVLAVLQRTEGADRSPQPGAGDVMALVDAARSAGQQVTVVGAVPVLAPTQGLVLYRAVQESLTNARRHAPGQPVTITLGTGATPSGVDQSSELSRGIPRATSDTKSPVVVLRISNPLVPRTSPGAPGRGLLGMRERVESIGGTLAAGEDDGSFVVVLTLPGDEPGQATAPGPAEASLNGSTGDPLDVHLLDVPDGTSA